MEKKEKRKKVGCEKKSGEVIEELEKKRKEEDRLKDETEEV